MDTPIESYVRSYGYWGVFLWAALGGEESLVVALWLVERGLLHLPGVIAASALGGAFGDQLCFYLARCCGWVRMRRSVRFQRAEERARALLLRYGSGVVLASRFLVGLRMTIPVVCGTLGMPALRYSLLNLVSAILWASFYGVALPLVGSGLAPAIRCGGVGASLALVAGLLVMWARRRRRRARSIARGERRRTQWAWGDI